MSAAVGAAAAAGFFYFVVPHIVGLGPTLRRLRAGDLWWLIIAVAFEAASLFGDIVTFRGVFAARAVRLGWVRTADIRLAGTAATKLFAAAGAGGVAFTVWALHAYGVAGATAADGMVCYMILTYAVYMLALAIAGFGLWTGVFSGRAPLALTLMPAAVATVVILVVVSMLYVYEPVERFLESRAERSTGRAAERWRRAAKVPTTLHAGLADALAMVKRRDASLVGAVAYWGFDIAALWASFRAFGHSPPGAVLVTGYYIGTLGNALPLPGGIGGVEGGMIGAFVGFGVTASLATLAVLAYRTISYWLPTVPGAIAYLHVRRDLAARRAAGRASPEADASGTPAGTPCADGDGRDDDPE